MSKRLKNYPEPGIVLDKYGADALRLYLINSPVVRAETLKFKEEGVKEIISKVFLPWYNAFKFFITQTAVLKKVKKHPLLYPPSSLLMQHHFKGIRSRLCVSAWHQKVR